MNKLTIKTGLVLSSMLVAASASADDHPYAKLQQQISTMSKIMSDNLPKVNGRHGTSIASTYLAGQGIVFKIDSSPFSHWQWSSHAIDIPEFDVPVPPTPPVVVGDGDFEMEFYDDENIRMVIQQSMEDAEDIIEIVKERYHNQKEEARELRDQERELAHEMRSLERELRSLEYRNRRVESDDKEEQQEISKEMAEIKQEKEKLAARKEKIAKQKKAVKAETKKLEQKRALEKKKYYEQIGQSITESLCHFGNGLRALPKNENVNVIVKGAGGRSTQRTRDVIYVYSKADIRDCSLEKIDEKKLLTKAKSYQY